MQGGHGKDYISDLTKLLQLESLSYDLLRYSWLELALWRFSFRDTYHSLLEQVRSTRLTCSAVHRAVQMNILARPCRTTGFEQRCLSLVSLLTKVGYRRRRLVIRHQDHLHTCSLRMWSYDFLRDGLLELDLCRALILETLITVLFSACSLAIFTFLILQLCHHSRQ